jgi:hypothetical protein
MPPLSATNTLAYLELVLRLETWMVLAFIALAVAEP